MSSSISSPSLRSTPTRELEDDVSQVDIEDPEEVRLVIAVDYGTTFTGVAFATPKGYQLPFHEITLVTDYGPKQNNQPKVPSVISFSQPSELGEGQWGFNLSPGAISIVQTKLELDVQHVKDELDLVLQNLDGMRNLTTNEVISMGSRPVFSYMTAEQIVEEYLEKVFEYVLENHPRIKTILDTFPVDIVITVPTGWSDGARNSTYKAVTNAGFNRNTFVQLRDVMFISEPEAAALYTARFLKEELNDRFLKPGECFVLCDAGGGTVDVVTYQVVQVEPLQLKRVGLPSGRKCGAVHVDRAFKEWLRSLLGERNYKALDPDTDFSKATSHAAESEQMRELMKRFDALKKRFSSKSRDQKLDLPEPHKNLVMPGKVNKGLVVIPTKVMAGFFNDRVNQIVEMFEEHYEDARHRKRKKVKNLFLAGGFSESPYLQELLKESCEMRKVKLRRPRTAWSAVVQGAVLAGVEKVNDASLTFVTCFEQSYGIVMDQLRSNILNRNQDYITSPFDGLQYAERQLEWLFHKGDVIFKGKDHETNKDHEMKASTTMRINWNENVKDKPSGWKSVAIWTSSEETLDDRPTTTKDSEDDLGQAGTLEYDISLITPSEWEKRRNKARKEYLTTVVKIELTMRTNILEGAIYDSAGVELCRAGLMA